MNPERIAQLGSRVFKNKAVRTAVFVAAALAEPALAHPVHAQTLIGIHNPVEKTLIKIASIGLLSGAYFGSTALMLRQMEGMSRRQRTVGRWSLIVSGVGTVAADAYIGFYV